MEAEKKEIVSDVRKSVFLHLKKHHAKQILFYFALLIFFEAALFSTGNADMLILPPALFFFTVGYLWFVAQKEIEEEFWKEFASRNGYFFERKEETGAGSFAPSAFLDFGTDWTKINLARGEYQKHPFSFFNFVTKVIPNDQKHLLYFTACEAKILQKVPNVILHARGGWTNMPRSFSGLKEFTLEGDFNKHFSVYVEKEKERDLLEILTPDVMEKLISYAPLFNFEFREDRLYVIAEKTIATRGELDAMNEAARYLVEKVPRYFAANEKK